MRPDILLDAELSALGDHAAAGAAAYRKNLARILADLPVESLPHEEIIVRLDEAAKRFKMLVLKTTLAIPYTSVFVRLECGYWNEAAERRLRNARMNRRLVNDKSFASTSYHCSFPECDIGPGGLL